MSSDLKELADEFRDQAARLNKAADALDPPAPKQRRKRRANPSGNGRRKTAGDPPVTREQIESAQQMQPEP